MEQDDNDEEEEKFKEKFKEHKLYLSWAIGPFSSFLLLSPCCIMTLFKFQKGHWNLGTHYRQHDTCNLNRVRNGCAMVAKPGTIVLIMKMASKVGPLWLFCCMKFLRSNDFGGRLSAKPEILMVGYSRTRTRIYKSTAYCRESTSGKTLGGTRVYKYPLAHHPNNNYDSPFTSVRFFVFLRMQQFWPYFFWRARRRISNRAT